MRRLILDRFNRNIHSDVFQRHKRVTIHEFPSGAEYFVDENYETCSDGAMYIEQAVSERGEGDREKSIERGARRAKTRVRRIAKALQADCMITLTYRELVTDLERLKRDFKAFVRRLSAITDFHYVACPERQERGAWHLHVVCRAVPPSLVHNGVKVKSFNLLRSIWYSIVGHGMGSCNVSATKGRNRLHRAAAYISKYVVKAFSDGLLNSKRYWVSRGIPQVKPQHLLFPAAVDTWELLTLIAHDWTMRGYNDFIQYRDSLNEFYWFSAARG